MVLSLSRSTGDFQEANVPDDQSSDEVRVLNCSNSKIKPGASADAKRQKPQTELHLDQVSKSLDILLEERPLQWSLLISSLTRRASEDPSEAEPHFRRALWLGSNVLCPDTRINSFVELLQLLSSFPDPRVIREAIIDCSGERSALHLSCQRDVNHTSNNLHRLSNHAMAHILWRYATHEEVHSTPDQPASLEKDFFLSRLLKPPEDGRETLLHSLVRWTGQDADEPSWQQETMLTKTTIFEIVQHVCRCGATDALLWTDEDGNTPLHAAIRARVHNTDHTVERILFDGCPRALMSENHDGLSPLKMIIHFLAQELEITDENSAKRQAMLQLLRYVMQGRASLEYLVEGRTKRNALHLSCQGNGLDDPICPHLVALILQHKSYAKSGVSLALEKDVEGSTPLHLACANAGCSSDVLRQLLLACPRAASEPNRANQTPLLCFAGSHYEALRKLLLALEDPDKSSTSVLLGPHGDLFCKLTMLAQAYLFDRVHPQHSKHIVHSMVQRTRNSTLELPDVVFKVLLRVHSSQLLEYQPSLDLGEGNGDTDQLALEEQSLPIHKWCMNPSFVSSSSRVFLARQGQDQGEDVFDDAGDDGSLHAVVGVVDDEHSDDEDDSEDEHSDEDEGEVEGPQLSTAVPVWLEESQALATPLSMLQDLIHASPDSLQALTRKGRASALHLAIKSGHSHEPTMQVLLKANPVLLRLKDHNSGLYPFMYAAAQKDEQSQSQLQQLEADLGTTYSLLRADPSLLSDEQNSIAYRGNQDQT